MQTNGRSHSSRRLVCPICDNVFERAESSTPPFCSPRCRQIDLGRWLGESYGLPYEAEDRIEAENRAEEDEFD